MTSIHHNCLAADHAGGGGGQEANQAGDIFRGAKPAGRCGRLHPVNQTKIIFTKTIKMG